MNILCLCPTYGRPKHLLENTLACFENQTYDKTKRYLLMYDDLGNVLQQRGDRWEVLSTNERAPCLSSKYNKLIDHTKKVDMPVDVLAVWDDDDLYLPGYLQELADSLGDRLWAHPEMVWSTYTGVPKLEPAAGRFHGSLAITMELCYKIGGWPLGGRADFDQVMIQKCAALGGQKADSGINYVFRWQDTQAMHCQGLMTDPSDTTWYKRVGVSEPSSIGLLEPTYDDGSVVVMSQLGIQV